ncbi:XRE family transcriptional regulator [Lacticaseibacillus hulanensis]|uniref:XRE family transcriptional regulator n=1 Tax=Lacticaseibacillus hulanensis TaxID=2493111 RepID=UPI000FD815E0|nr:XRE family transcriptional regulator [Lacticaseibacillus hulanensis]
MLESEFGPIYRDFRVSKGFSMREASDNKAASIQFLSQFERGNTRIGFVRLGRLLENIHVSMEELLAVRSLRSSNWLDWWAFALDYAQRTGDARMLSHVLFPERVERVVRAVNRVILLSPLQRRNELTRVEKFALTNIVNRSQHYGVFVNLIITHTAIALPASVRRHAIATLDRQSWWDDVLYLRPGTSFSAMWALAEAEVYMHNSNKAKDLMQLMGQHLSPSDLYERLTLLALEAEADLAQGLTQEADKKRADVIATLRVLDDHSEVRRYLAHTKLVWPELGVK